MEQEKKPAFTVRQASIDDIEAIRRMHAQSWLDTYPNEAEGVSYDWVKQETDSWLTPEKLEDSRDYFSEKLDNPDHFYRIATSGERVIGLIHGLKQDGRKHLGALYVDSEYHGTGVAQELMNLVDDWFGDDEVDLEVVAYNERAKAFYRKHGFEEAGEKEPFKGKLPSMVMIRKARKNEV